MKAFWVILGILWMGSGVAEEVLVTKKDGQCFFYTLEKEQNVDPQEVFDFWGLWASKEHGQYLGYPRDYDAPVLPHERMDIHFIITTLANKSIFTIAKNRGALEDAGARIDHLHPFKFLSTVFCDEELKVGIRNIRSKGWIWSDFSSGMKEALSTEMCHGNITDAQIAHFASVVQIDVQKIYHPIHECRWDDFIDILIREIPREGNSGRYDS